MRIDLGRVGAGGLEFECLKLLLVFFNPSDPFLGDSQVTELLEQFFVLRLAEMCNREV